MTSPLRRVSVRCVRRRPLLRLNLMRLAVAPAPAGLFWRGLMGRMETGAPSTSDPAYGNAAAGSALRRRVSPAPAPHPVLPAELITPPHWSDARNRATKESGQGVCKDCVEALAAALHGGEL